MDKSTSSRSPDPIDRAIAQVAPIAAQDPGAHTVMRGLEKVGGEYTGRECVVVLVEEKKPLAEVQYVLPHAVPVNSEGGEVRPVRVDVQEAAPFKILLLHYGEWTIHSSLGAQASNPRPHQQCFSPTVPGGVQIAPAGANWVGTLGVPWRWKDQTGGARYGFLTNRHVAGLESKFGHRVGQPNPSARPVGELVTSWRLNTQDTNQLDLALYDSLIDGRHHVRPEVFGLRGLTAGVADLKLGDLVTKSGRTTGVTTGRVVGLDAQTTVNYGERGNLKFTQQVVIEGDGGGSFSEAGDSGASIWKVSGDRRVFSALLFAGGGGKTLANPGRLVVEALGGEPFVA